MKTILRDSKMRIATVVCLAVIAGSLFVSVIDSLAAREDVDGQMTQLRAASTRRIDLLTQNLKQEQQEGDNAEARANRYMQQLCDNHVVPFDKGECK